MKKLVCISPINGSVYAERKVDSRELVEDRLRSARKAQRGWSVLPVSKRRAIVDKAIEILADMNEDLVTHLAWQMGRPIRYGGEIGGVKERAGYMSDIAEQALSPSVIEDSSGFRRYISREPLGLILVIAPWNYPYMTAINAIVPGLIAGNAVFLKHATQTLLVGEHLEQAFAQAGLPDGLFCNLRLDHELTASLIAARCFDFVNFTGSVNAGRSIERAAAGTFIGLGLELGGKDPGYVRHDADLDAAVDTLIDGAMFNSGQCCCGIERIYVHNALFDDFCAKATTIVSGYHLGNPLESQTTLGPMANLRFANLVREQISEAISAGATPLVDGAGFEMDTGDSTYLAPQILVNVDHSMRVMKEESFGPVVGIVKVDSDEEAVSLMNDSDFGLTASIWSSETSVVEQIGRKLQTGTVFMNRCDYLDPALCWTGCKDTGRGMSLSAQGYQSLTRVKSYHLKQAI
ncbi:MAG: aldehyde dehydrogenase family protein [bacterium]